MKKKYIASMIVILIMIASLIIVGVGYTKYQEKEEETTAMIKVKSGLSINYLKGNKVNTTEEAYELNVSITNTEAQTIYYFMKLNNIEADESMTYKLTSINSPLSNKEEKLTKPSIGNRIAIEPNTTQSYTLSFSNPNKHSLITEVLVDLEVIDNSLRSTILKDNEIEANPQTSFDTPSTQAEGLIEQTTDEGVSYYFRGDIQNNYVSFANELWRVVKINPDGTTKLVLNRILEESTPFYENNEYSSTSFLDSDVYRNLSTWYEEQLNEYDSYIASSKYCTDDNAATEENGSIYYLPENRLFKDFKPVSTCPGTTSTSKIGLLTADDVMYAGGSIAANQTYFLYQPQINGAWWTMTLNKKENGQFHYIVIQEDGALKKDTNETSQFSLRPSITLIKKLNTTGTGTLEDPYQVSTV